MAGIRVQQLDHLGIVAGVCQEIGMAAYVDELGGPSRASGERGHGDRGDDSEWTGLCAFIGPLLSGEAKKG
jgi:hypothetical protein